MAGYADGLGGPPAEEPGWEVQAGSHCRSRVSDDRLRLFLRLTQ